MKILLLVDADTAARMCKYCGHIIQIQWQEYGETVSKMCKYCGTKLCRYCGKNMRLLWLGYADMLLGNAVKVARI